MKAKVKKYSKPKFRRVTGIEFVIRLIHSPRQSVYCQCSSCHGCR